MNYRIISLVSIALLVALCIYPSATTEAQMFEPGVDYGTGEYPNKMSIADLNGDSNLDLAVPNSYSWTHTDYAVSVLLGNGDGTFQAAVDYGTGDSPSAVAVADLNGDGFPDLITVNPDSEDVSVLLGNGNGTFQTCVNYWIGDVNDIVIGDLDGDGDTDIAVSTYYPSSVMVLLGNGDGTFQPGAEQVFSVSCHSIAIGDLDQDSIPDLVVTTSWAEGRVWVLLGNGDATFQTAVFYGVGNIDSYSSVAIGDLNGDSIPDLATANDASVSVLLGNGDGTFQQAIEVEDIYPSSVAIGDLDGDGIPDLVMSTYDVYSNQGTSSVLLGNGDGTFWPPLYFDTVAQTTSVAMGDLDNDGSLDLAVTTAGENFVSVLINRGKPVTLFTDFSCVPGSGDVPFDSRMTVSLLNRVPDQPRLVAARIQLDLANGQSISNWKAGYQNIVGDGHTTTSWYQTIPALGSLIGYNVFTLIAEDVTPAPWNQPPYPASGYRAEFSDSIYARTYTMSSLTKNGYLQ